MKKYFTQILVGSGFIGFCVTLLLYFNLLELKTDTFHEILINQNELIDSFNIKRISSLKKNVDSLGALRESRDTNYKLVSQEYFQQSQQLALSVDTLRKYRPGKVVKFFESSQVDTLINNGVRMKRLLAKTGRDSLDFLIVDTLNTDFPYHFKSGVYIASYRHNTDFFLKYPAFGIWALGVTALISIWCILLVIFFASLYEFKGLIKNNSKKSGIYLTRKKTSAFILYSSLLVIAFFTVGKFTVYDKYNIVPENIFMLHYMFKFAFLLMAALVIACFFFGGYLIMGDILKQCTIQTAATPESDTGKLDAINTVCKAALSNLKKYFIITAMSLTGVVIVTGVLFTAVNNLEFSKVYFQSFRRNILNYDTVYLFGGLYSLLILLFYLPLQLTFSKLKEDQPAAVKALAASAEDTKPFYKSKDFWDRMKETFAVSSPLLASLIQWLIESVSK